MRRIRRRKTSSTRDNAFRRQILENYEYLRGLVSRMAELAARAPDGFEDIDFEEALVADGTDRLMARRLVAFVPIAFGQVVLAGLGLEPGTEFTFRNESGRWCSRTLGTVREYLAAESLISELARTPGFRALAARDARVRAVNNALREGESLDSVQAGSLSNPVLIADGADLGIF